MEITAVKINEISNHPTMRMDAEYWDKKKNLQIGTRVLVAHNLEGNMDEPFIGKEGVITSFKKNDWYQIVLDNGTIYGKKFNFHIEEIEIICPEFEEPICPECDGKGCDNCTFLDE
jgi:hypothetical protein